MKSILAVILCATCVTLTAQAQLFSDNFTRGTDPGPLTPWATNAGGGNWTVTGGVMKGGLNPTLSYGFTFITNNFTNFSAQAQFQFPVGAFGGGLGGRLNTNTGTHYAAWIYPENSAGGSNVLKLLRFNSYSSFDLLQQTNLAAVGTTSHTAKLEFSGSLINVYFDTNKLLSVTDATYPSGSVSLDFWTDATGYQMTVDNVSVSAIPLVANSDSYAAVLGMPLTVAAPGVLANDTGGNGTLSAVLATNAAHGTLTLNSNGSFTYNATNNFTGTDTFAYRATDGQSNSTPAVVTITVGPDHPPVANSDAYTVLQNSTLTVAAPGVLANDTDADGNTLTAALVSGVANGTLNLSTNGGFTYTPTTGFAGTDSFTYRANDGLSNSANATVTISVLSIVPLYSDSFSRTNLSPWVAQSGAWAVTNNALRGGTNATTSYGVVYLTNSWSNYSAQASVQFPAGAFGGGLDACLNPATGARYSAWIYPEGSAGGSNTLKLIKFQDWTTFAYNGVAGTAMQSVNLAAVGTNSHTLKLACAGTRIGVFLDGTLMISVTDTDTGGAAYTAGGVSADFWTATTAYQMTVDDVLVASLANDDSYSVVQNQPLTVAAPGVLGNDTEIYGSTLSAVQVTGPTNGTLSLSANGGFTYTPAAGYTGPDSFTYQASDGGASLGTARVSLAVLPSGFSENFDGVTAPALPSGWTTSVTGAQTAWVTRTTANDTAPNAAYVPDPAQVGTSDLITPSIALPSGQSRLSFRNNYSLEGSGTEYDDGGVLEIKIGAGAYTDILAAGGSFVSGGYNGTISLVYSNSLAGRQAWSGNSGGFITTMVDLPAAAMNQSIQLRWRCGTDTGNGNTVTNGWYIDTVVITNCACACCWNTPPLLPAQTDQTISELTPLNVNNAASDADLPTQTLTYTLLSAPSGAAIGTNTGIITWTPTQAQSPSTNPFTTRVTDTGSPALSSTNNFTVTVREVNVAPTPPTVATQTVSELTLMTVTNTATNANIHSIISGYRLVSPPTPTGASISPSGIITWTPTQAQSPSTNTITTVVTNSNPYDLTNPQLLATNSFTVIVREANVAPTLPFIPDQTLNVLNALTVTNTATNANIHSTISGYRLVTTVTNASISPNGVIIWAPTQAQSPSTNLFTTIATNSNPYDLTNPHLTATNSFTVYVYSGPYVVVDSTALVTEGFFPTNNAIDPGETVTLRFALKNLGGANTTNLVATLLTTNGVTAPSGPQSYGVLTAGGANANQLFSFTASGTCGGTVTPTLQLQDGTANYGMVAVSFTMGQVGTVLTQNFDSVTSPALPANWTAVATGTASGWITTNALADTAPNAAFAPDLPTLTTNDLISPPILLSLGQAQISFRHSYSFEADSTQPTNGYDGGVLEIKIGTNDFTDITNNGGSWIANGYTRKIDTRYQSPLASRWAWSGTNGGYVTSTASLPPAAAGQTIQLRWRCATDNGGPTGSGWRVDSIGLSGVVCGANTPPVLPTQADRTITELTTLMVTNTASDLESPPEVLTYSLPVAPTNATISTNTGVITWTPTQAQSPSISNVFTTVVRDNASPSASATNTFYVTVREVNLAPSLPDIPDQTVNELSLLTVNNAATNANIHSTIAGYALVNPQAGMAINASGVFTWTPAQNQSPGTNTVTTVVTNSNPYDLVNPSLTATKSFKVVVREVNVAPSLPDIADQTVNELSLLTVNSAATNANIHSAIAGYALVNPQAGMAIDASGVFTWTPSQNQSPGTNTVTTVVTNSNPYDLVNPSLTATKSFKVVVREVNVAPSLPDIADQTVNELSLLTVNSAATNANIHSAIAGYALVNPQAGMAIDASGVFTWTPAQNQSPGTNTVTTVVTNNNPYDLVNPSLTATKSFKVVVREVNVAPSLPDIADQTVNELSLLTVNSAATNANIHSAIAGYALVNPQAGMAIDASGVFTWTPSQNQSPGTNTVTTVVTNSNPYDLVNPSLTATKSFKVVVREVNVAPSLPDIADQTVNELSLLTVNSAATNANIHSAIAGYALVNPQAGMAIDASGVFTWTPAQNQSPGTNTVTTVVTNNNPYDLVNPSLTATKSFKVVVREVNVAPSLPDIADQTVNELSLLTVNSAATNANIHSTIAGYALVNPQAGMAIDASGVFTWTPAQTQSPGTNTVTTIVTNSNPYDLVNPSLTATKSFKVVVREVNVPPTLPDIADKTVDELTLLTVPSAATNANIHSTIAGYALVNPPTGAAIDDNGIITWTPSHAQSSSTNTITTMVTNTNPFDLANPRLTATKSFKVIVNAAVVVSPPVMQSISMSNGVVTLTWSAVSGRKYRLQCQDGPLGTNWHDALGEFQATGGTTATCTNAPGDMQQRFYRVYMLP